MNFKMNLLVSKIRFDTAESELSELTSLTTTFFCAAGDRAAKRSRCPRAGFRKPGDRSLALLGNAYAKLALADAAVFRALGAEIAALEEPLPIREAATIAWAYGKVPLPGLEKY